MPDENELDHYSVLGLCPSASNEEIDAAAKFMRAAFHPDVHRGNHKKMAESHILHVEAAIKTLTEAGAKKRFDRWRAAIYKEAAPSNVFSEVLQNVPLIWYKLAMWLRANDVDTPISRKFSYDVGRMLETHKAFSEKQKAWAEKIWTGAVKQGFDPKAAHRGDYDEFDEEEED